MSGSAMKAPRALSWNAIGVSAAGILAIIGVCLAGYSLSGLGGATQTAPAVAAMPGLTVAAIALSSLGFIAVLAAWQRAAMLGRRVSTLERTVLQVSVESDAQRNQLHGLAQSVDAKVELRAEALAAELKVVETLLRQMVDRRTAAEPGAAPERAVPAEPPAVDNVALDIVRNAIEDSRVELHLQPVVRLPSRKIAHYEALSRVRDSQGSVIFPNAYLPAAEASGLVTAIDNLLLFRCINLIRALGPKRAGVRLFVNLSSRSLADRDFINDFIGFVRQHRDLNDRIVFEIAADDLERFAPATLDTLTRLAKAGFAFSIDNVRSIDVDTESLRRLNVQYLKIDARILLADDGTIRAEDLKAMLARIGVDLIVTRIETERDVIEVLELGADFGQGYLFGQPRPARLAAPESADAA